MLLKMAKFCSFYDRYTTSSLSIHLLWTLRLLPVSLFSCLVVSDSVWPMDCNTPGFPVYHQLLELARAHIHWISDAIQPFYPLSSPSTPSFNFPSIRVFLSELVFPTRWPKYWSFSFSISLSNEYLGLTGLLSLQSKGLLRVFSNTPVQKHQFFGTHPSLWSNSHIHTWLQERNIALTI